MGFEPTTLRDLALNGSLIGGRLKIASVRPSPSPPSSPHSSSLLLREGGLCTQAKLKTDGKNNFFH